MRPFREDMTPPRMKEHFDDCTIKSQYNKRPSYTSAPYLAKSNEKYFDLVEAYGH